MRSPLKFFTINVRLNFLRNLGLKNVLVTIGEQQLRLSISNYLEASSDIGFTSKRHYRDVGHLDSAETNEGPDEPEGNGRHGCGPMVY